jgi:hypothetical protein
MIFRHRKLTRTETSAWPSLPRLLPESTERRRGPFRWCNVKDRAENPLCWLATRPLHLVCGEIPVIISWMSHGAQYVRVRLAGLKQKQLELTHEFEVRSAAGLETSELEALLVALAAEIALLESMVTS